MLALVAVISALCAGVPSYVAGHFFGFLGGEIARGDRDVEVVKQMIADNPEKFGSLTINRGPVDKFHLEGVVNSQADLDFLRAKMVRTFGEDRADYILAVTISKSADGG